jgi:hypothetical protein
MQNFEYCLNFLAIRPQINAIKKTVHKESNKAPVSFDFEERIVQ